MIVAAVIAAIGSVAAAYISIQNRKKIQEVHVLVNQQLTDVMDRLKIVTQERDDLDPEKGPHRD
jgi:hypothetical protein